MAELTPMERLQPCLLDRLTDDEPEKNVESREKRVISAERYRSAVLRDMAWLLNANAHEKSEDINLFEEVSQSVLNYGIPNVCGLYIDGFSNEEIEKTIKDAIRKYEPRINPDSLQMNWVKERNTLEPTTISFEIRGNLWAQPLPEAFYVKTSFDLETDECNLSRGSSSG